MKDKDPINLSHLEGGACRHGEEPVVQALTSSDKSAIDSLTYDVEGDMFKPNNTLVIFEDSDILPSKGKKPHDVIIVGGGDSGLPYKLTDMLGGNGVSCKVHDDLFKGHFVLTDTAGGRSSHFNHLANRGKGKSKLSKPVTLRNLFLNRR